MDAIRKNNEKEVIYERVKLEMPILMYVLYAILILGVGLVPFIMGISYRMAAIAVTGVVVAIAISILFFIAVSQLKKCAIVISNKRIYGVKWLLLLRKTFSYRLDMINSVESTSILGLNSIKIKYTNGDLNSSMFGASRDKVFKVGCVENVEYNVDGLDKLLRLVKNDKDVLVNAIGNKLKPETSDENK